MAPSTALRDPTGEMPLAEHLEELRSRLIRSLWYVVAGLVAGWMVYPLTYSLLWAPMERVLAQHPGWEPMLPDITEAFNLRLQISFYSGLLLALPLITFEAWGFLAPGLTRGERRMCRFLFPLSVGLFFLGAWCGYGLTEPALQWFAGHVPEGWRVMQTPVPYLTFMAKLVVGFGLAFQAPVVVLLLSWLGLVTSAGLRRQWRYCLVGCFLASALTTPGGEPFTMLLMAAPLLLLYGLCIVLCAWVEWVRGRR